MRNVAYSLTNSLDNFIARPDGGADWILMDDELMTDFPRFFERFDTVLMGRKSYDVAYAQSHTQDTGKGEAGFMGMKTYVFSRTMKQNPGGDVELVSGGAGEFVRDLKTASGKDIWLMGGGNLAASLFKEDLIDEIGLTLQPVLLGSGIPLFPNLDRQIDVQLVDSKIYKNGTVSLTYQVKR